jgi:hypothetical protein
MIKRALLVGCNYPGTPSKLNGCINDIMTTNEIIRSQYGFNDNAQIRMLTDQSCTTKNILERLHWLVDGLVPGDVAFFHWSGHGAQMPVTSYENNEEPDGLDEIICPVDIDWRTRVIKDNDMKQIFDKVPVGVNITVLLDACHSGSGIKDMMETPSPNKTKSMTTPVDIMNRSYGQMIEPKPRAVMSPTSVVYEDQTGLLISGCTAKQTSADAWVQQRNKYMGAATYALSQTLLENNWVISYEALVQQMNGMLNRLGYEQTPELNGQSQYFQIPFLSSMR